jgi:PAS domain S-box-containing protein
MDLLVLLGDGKMDIADRQKMDEALRASEEKYRELAESTEAIMWEFDILTDRWTYVAPQSLRILGYAPEEWTNLQFWTDHLHPEDRDWASQYCAECTERGERHIFEYRFLRKDGGITWLRDIVSVEMQDSSPVKLRGFMIDITDRKQAENALRASEENLAITLNSIGDAVIATDENGLIVRMNPVAEKLCGWPCEKAKGKPLEDVFRIINSETRDVVPNPVNIVLEKGEVVGLANHTALISRDGTEYQISDSAAPIRNKDGLTMGVILVFSDVTKDYALRKNIEESEKRYRSLFSSTIDSICLHEIVNKDDKPVDYLIIDVNPKYESVIGISREKAIGKLASELYGIGEPPFLDIYANVAETGLPTTFETYFEAMNKHFHISVFSPERGQFATVFQDITERKQMEEALRESEKNLQEAQHIAKLGRWDLDLRSSVLQWSPTIFHIFEIDPAKFGSNYASFLEVIHPEDRERVKQEYALSLIERQPYNIEHRLLMDDGRIKWVNEICRNEYDSQGQAIRSVGIVQDITERKQVDEALRALAESGDTSRDDIFKFLARQIAVSQGKRFSFIAEVDEDNKSTAYTIASWGNGEFTDNFSYPIEFTPCHKVVNGDISFFPRDLQSLFPKDHLLARVGAESYWGAPLRSTAGEVIGVLAILDDRPMEESPQTLSLLKSFAARASVEMERRSMDEKYRTLFTTMVQGVVYQNADGHIISANQAAEKILGLTFDQMQGRTSTDPHWRALREDGSVFPGEEHPAMVALQSGEEVKDVIMGIFNPANNTHTWINVHAIPLFRPGTKKPYQSYTTFEDITERRNVEQQVVNYILELEQLNTQLNKEMDKARHMHDRTLPKSLPEVEGISFAAHYQPAQKLGGDFYDVIQKDKKLIFYLSDVSGHGLDGAMLSVFVKHTIKGYLAFSPDNSISPANILRYLTKQFAQESYPEEYFICIFIAVLDLKSMELTYSGAGFQDTPFVRLGSGDKLRLTSKGLFITSYLPEK